MPKRQQDNMRRAQEIGEQEEKRKRGQEKERQEDCVRSAIGDGLAATANEHLKKDNKKAIEEHEEDRDRKKKTTTGQASQLCSVSCLHAATLSSPAGGQEGDKRRKRQRTKRGQQVAGSRS